jgi:glucose-6-phosphate 1-epimerase
MPGQTRPASFYKLTNGTSGLQKVVLNAPDNAWAEIYLHGAQVTSWKPAGGEEQLFLSRTSAFGQDASIRGGVPVIFPQFGKEGPLPRHGFARRMEWAFVKAEEGASGVTATFQCRDDQTTRRIWPHAFLARLEVMTGGQHLVVSLSVTNMDQAPFSFTGALHTYLAVSDIQEVFIEGLSGRAYLDTVGSRTERIQPEEKLAFRSEVDRIYFNAPPEVWLRDRQRQVNITTQGFPDVVVWNPWSELGATLADVEPDGYRRMVCVEAAVIGRPVVLAPSESWSGTQKLSV